MYSNLGNAIQAATVYGVYCSGGFKGGILNKLLVEST